MDALLSRIPRRVRIVEVGPRDGLQNESGIVPTEAKVEFVRLLAEAGFEEIEVSSFVHHARLPQLADAEELFLAITQSHNHPITYSALVPNRRGLDRAVRA